MSVYTVLDVGAEPKKTGLGKNADGSVYDLTLRNGDGSSREFEIYVSGNERLPQTGDQVEGSIKEPANPTWKASFIPARKGRQGGGGFKPRDPGERRSIEMQASQKVAVDAVRILADLGLWKPQSPGEVAGAVMAIAFELYGQCEQASNDHVVQGMTATMERAEAKLTLGFGQEVLLDRIAALDDSDRSRQLKQAIKLKLVALGAQDVSNPEAAVAALTEGQVQQVLAWLDKEEDQSGTEAR